jgi:hypothetical protein
MTEPSPVDPAKFPLIRKFWFIPGFMGLMLVICILSWSGMQSPPFSDDVSQCDKSSHFTSWKQVFEPDVFGYYRPVKNALFMVAAPLSEKPIQWHLIGLMAYFAAMVGVFRITLICLGNLRTAWVATTVWALSPTCVSTILWLSCANISIGLAIAAIVFECHERAAVKNSFAWFFGALIAYASTLLCYESFIALPGLLFLRDLQQRRIGFDRRLLIRYGLYTLIAVLFLFVRWYFSSKSIGANVFHSGFSPDTKAIHLTLSAPWFLWRHFLMWVFPFGNIEIFGSYEWLKSASALSLVLSWLGLIAMMAASAVYWKRFPMVSYGLLFFVVASVPSGNFLPSFNGPIYDAYLTFPSIGLALVIASICDWLLSEFFRRRRESGATALLAIFILLLVWRLPICGAYFCYWSNVWSQPIKLSLLVSDSRPHQFLAKGYASNMLLSEGYLDKAEEMAKEVVLESPWSAQAKLTLARLSEYRGDPVKAETLYREVLHVTHSRIGLFAEVNVELAELLSKTPSRSEDAANFCRATLGCGFTLSPIHLRAVVCLASIYEAQGLKDKSILTLQKGMLYHRNAPEIRQALDRLNATP